MFLEGETKVFSQQNDKMMRRFKKLGQGATSLLKFLNIYVQLAPKLSLGGREGGDLLAEGTSFHRLGVGTLSLILVAS